jgi:hypothetical protein
MTIPGHVPLIFMLLAEPALSLRYLAWPWFLLAVLAAVGVAIWHWPKASAARRRLIYLLWLFAPIVLAAVLGGVFSYHLPPSGAFSEGHRTAPQWLELIAILTFPGEIFLGGYLFKTLKGARVFAAIVWAASVWSVFCVALPACFAMDGASF